MISLICTTTVAFAQSGATGLDGYTDSLRLDMDALTTDSAALYLEKLLEDEVIWRPGSESMKMALERLVSRYKAPFDTIKWQLEVFQYDSIRPTPVDFVTYDTVTTRWLNDSTFILFAEQLEREPFVVEETIVRKPMDASELFAQDSMPDMEMLLDSVFREQDTIREVHIDSLYLDTLGFELYQVRGGQVIPPLLEYGRRQDVYFEFDSSAVIYTDTATYLVADEDSPFFIVPNTHLPDSLEMAVKKLLDHTWRQDSIQVFFNDIDGHRTPFWLTAGADDPKRYWVKNDKNDSITIWLGNPDKYDITMYLEEDVNINRMRKLTVENVPITTINPATALVKIEPLEEIPVYWEYDFATNLLFSQTFISDNWSKGGQSALSTLLDIKGAAQYTDKKAKTKWINSGRLKYGSIITKDSPMKTNTDMLEFNSQYNRLIKGKFDFSAVFYLKTQVAKGIKYGKEDTTVVSKFLNPTTFTLGAGVEYKPFKHTELNFSPLSYKNTFVLDTANIPQTAHGIPADRKALQEMGAQLLVTNKLNVWDGLEINSKLRLFSSYFNEPQNIDVDWEVNLKRRINWYFTVSANFHLIYDDDILFPLTDDNGDELKWPDGTVKKAPGAQFKEYVGLSFAFNF